MTIRQQKKQERAVHPPKDETSSVAAEKALGKVPDRPGKDDVQAVEQILKRKDEKVE